MFPSIIESQNRDTLQAFIKYLYETQGRTDDITTLPDDQIPSRLTAQECADYQALQGRAPTSLEVSPALIYRYNELIDKFVLYAQCRMDIQEKAEKGLTDLASSKRHTKGWLRYHFFLGKCLEKTFQTIQNFHRQHTDTDLYLVTALTILKPIVATGHATVPSSDFVPAVSLGRQREMIEELESAVNHRLMTLHNLDKAARNKLPKGQTFSLIAKCAL